MRRRFICFILHLRKYLLLKQYDYHLQIIRSIFFINLIIDLQYKYHLIRNKYCSQKTLLGLSGKFQTINIQLLVIQYLSGDTASYGFGNILVHRALTDTNFVSPTNTDIYGLPYSCLNGLFAYNGTCVATCPVNSFTSINNKNCTDYSSSESSIYNSEKIIMTNAYGTYIIKQFYQNNFEQSNIDKLFQVKPPTLSNYLNSESFSFIQSKKVLGGYYSWGYGTYQATFSNLIAHFQVRFFFTLYLIDGWQAGDTFTYQVDGTVVDTYTSNPTLQYQGLSTLDTIYVISGRKVSHGSSTLTISFNCNIAQQDSSKASCGIQNLFVLLDQNVNILCPLNSQYFSYTTQNCENCIIIPCQLYPTKQIVAKCSVGCLDCTSNTICTVCDSSNGYQLSGNACICLSNYIMVSSLCQKCNYSCATCSGTASHQCNSCDSSRKLSSSSCICNSNYYDVYSITPCFEITSTCHYSCNTCFGLQYYQCVTCPNSSNRTFQSTSNTCPCDTNYKDDGFTQCISAPSYICDISCLTCSASGNTNCQSCDSSKHRTNLLSGQCPCDSGYNDYFNPGSTCVENYTPCHYSCDTCYGSSNTNCLTCSSQYFRTLQSNLCYCNNGYLDLTIGPCKPIYNPCQYSCLTCFGANGSQCITCPATRILIIGSPGQIQNCDCQDGTFNNQLQTCAACDNSCQTCTAAGNNSCSSCDSTQNRTLQGTACPCSSGYNDILNPGKSCVLNYTPCHYSCMTCYGISNNQCLNCVGSQFRTLNNSVCQCNKNYGDAGQTTCVLCNSQCLTCFGVSSNQCLTCQIPLIINNNICQCPNISDILINNQCSPIVTQCHQSCLSCFDNLNTGCYQCASNRFFQKITRGNKICNCMDGYFEDASSNNICTKCHYSCLTCQTTSQNCLTCDTSSFRNYINNTCPCMLNYNDYLNSQQECVYDLQVCNYSSQTCFGEGKDQCLSCPLQSQRNFSQFQCICGNGYFDNRKSQCDKCDFLCELCENQFDNCLKCNENHFRYLNLNKCICLDGFYDNNVPICQPCNQDCKICDKNQCLQCKSDQRQLINGQCLCYDGYYLLDQKCYQCENQCLTCIGIPNFYCLTCGNNRILINNQCECIKGNFSYQNACLSCSIKEGKQYKECQYLNYNDGVWTPGENCDDGNMIPRDGCTELNIDNGYQCDNKLMTPSICYQCPDNCQKCLQSNNKVQCINCIQNYFEYQSYCYKCYDENCITCLNHSYCSKCLYNIQAKNGKCIMCEQGYKQQGKTCLSICGDGIRTSDEECDDNNQYNNDGCSSQCKIEQGYICNPQCRLEQNDIKAKLLKSGNQTNNIQIEILNYIFDLTQLEIKIDLLSIDQDYQFNISSINQNKFEIKFIFYKPIKSFNIIHVYLPIKQNQRFLDYIVREMQVIPEEADYYDTTQQSQRQTIQTTQQQFYQSLLYIGPIAFLLGGTSFFIQILDILSWINNFYYINVNYPGNVQIFFQQSNWGLIFSLPQIFQFEIQDNNSQLPQKFQDKGVDSLILNNIQQTLLILIIIICCIPLSKYIQNQIKRYSSKNFKRIKKIKIENELMVSSSQIQINQNQQQQHKCNYFIQTLSNQLQDFYINRYAILLKTINLNILDIILAIMINLKYQSYFNEILQIICFILCLMMTILCITYFYCLYFIAYLHQTLFRLKFFKNLSKELFEGIKSDKISRFYGFQSIFQKSLFIIFIVLFFERPLQQTLFCSSVLSGLIVVSTYQYPFKMKKDLLTQFIPDILLAIILLFSTILAADEQFNELSFQSRYNIGWIIIGLIGVSIFIQIVFILKEAFQQILIKFKWIKSIFL